jgi:hypothetical protein
MLTHVLGWKGVEETPRHLKDVKKKDVIMLS